MSFSQRGCPGLEQSPVGYTWSEQSWRATLSSNTSHTKPHWDGGIAFLEGARKNGWISTAYMEYPLFAANML